MGRFLRDMSLAGQILLITAACLILTAGAAMVGVTMRWELTVVLSIGAVLSIAGVMVAVRRLLVIPLDALDARLAQLIEGNVTPADGRPMPSRDLQRLKVTFDRMVGHVATARTHFEEAQRVLASRTSTVDRLLEFSQTIQGAGNVAQVFESLSHYARTELSLAGITIISNEPEQTPPMRMRSSWPESLVRTDAAVGDLEASACPCLRQHLPKCFRREGSPVRCAVDSCLSLGPEYPAYCIPFNVGRHMQVVVHMLLPVDQAWTDERKQLAQTYVNTAVSTLISLHLLEEAEKQSMTDGLTGLYNRRSMESLLQREVALSERHTLPLALVMIDMDRFKQINDAYGHAAGDHMLKSFADCVRMTLRKTDLAFRYGGDEFVICLPQTTNPQAVQVVQKLRQAFGAVDFSHAKKWWGFLGFDDCKEERSWGSEEIHVLKTAAALIAGAIEREQADERIKLSEERYALAARGANDGLFDWDIASGKTFFSPRLHEVLGLKAGDLGETVDALIDRFAKTDADFLRATLRHKFQRREETFDLECRHEAKHRSMQWIVLRGLIVYGEEGPRRVVGGLRDVTRQMEVQKRLSEAERKRANLARYFSPNMVDGLMQSGGRLDEARTQKVTVLFADIWGYTAISSALPPMQLMALLREHLRMFEKAIFANGGTLDKFLGDGLMATFGTPKAGPRDAANALSCASAMADAIARWNRKRRENGLKPMYLGIGLHHGDVVLGDIGSERRMEFAVIGDTVNVASRIQEMTRALDIAVLASDGVIQAARAEAGDGAVKEFTDRGEHELRGRGGKIRLWGLAAEKD